MHIDWPINLLSPSLFIEDKTKDLVQSTSLDFYSVVFSLSLFLIVKDFKYKITLSFLS